MFSEDEYRPDQVVNAYRKSRSSVYAARSTYSAGKPATIGLMYVRYTSSRINQANGIPSTNNGEIDVVSHFGSLQLTEEYSRSDAATRHDLTYIGAKVTLTSRDSITAFNYHIGDNANIGQDSAYPTGCQGNRYFYEHFFSKKLEIIPFYESDRQLYGNGRDTSTWVTLQYTY